MPNYSFSIPVHLYNPPAIREMEAETRVLRNVFPPISHFSHCGFTAKPTDPIVLDDNTDLNGCTADPQAPYQPQGSLVLVNRGLPCRLKLSVPGQHLANCAPPPRNPLVMVGSDIA
ncbi:UNVERIFIED_CONTAM: hypothetical protein FKN15_071545 [Acipenser sinensis]